MACLEGLEPPTRGLEGRCSIQLSYRQPERPAGTARRISGRPDSNWGPPAPKAGALTRLRYAPPKREREVYVSPAGVSIASGARNAPF